MANFEYLIDKINSTEFDFSPFKHIYIEDFFSQEHFDSIINAPQINLDETNSVEELIELIQSNNYRPVIFPGCTTDISRYLKSISGQRVKTKSPDLTEGIGISFRIQEYQDDFIKELMIFLNSDLFLKTLQEKFKKEGVIRVETAIQKYLSGYEISPHPDIRKKCLTYMVNINPSPESENLNIHTHYMKFKDRYKDIYNFWQTNKDVDRCWVPWSWAETVKRQTKNNSIVIFAPNNDTLHAVKADYNHLKTQRTQIYGNLWYNNKKIAPLLWKDLAKTVGVEI